MQLRTKVVQEIYSQDKDHRILILERSDGTFCYEEQRFSQREAELCWIPKKRQTIGLYDRAETALREAIANVDWLRVESTETGGNG
jgi:hypothetical protein